VDTIILFWLLVYVTTKFMFGVLASGWCIGIRRLKKRRGSPPPR